MSLRPWKVAFVRRVPRVLWSPGSRDDASTILNRWHGVEGEPVEVGVGMELKSSQPGFQASTPLRRSASSHRPQAAMSASMAPCNERLLLPPVLHNLTTAPCWASQESAVAGWVSWRGRCMQCICNCRRMWTKLGEPSQWACLFSVMHKDAWFLIQTGPPRSRHQLQIRRKYDKTGTLPVGGEGV